MPKEKMIVVGEKESFIARTLINKASGAGVQCDFVQWNIQNISETVGEVSLIVLYMDDNAMPPEDVLHFLEDSMEEHSQKLIVVGEQVDIQFVLNHISSELIYSTFSRPIDNTKFAQTITGFFQKAESGAFKKSILIVDDDPQYLTLVREWLKGTYRVFMANSGLQAIKLLGKNKVDLILLDHEMPVTSGPQVLEMLRSDPETASIPVMFLTGKGDRESVMAVVALKPEGYFLKNIQKEELLEKLQEFFILHK